eukprot:TRINITY_DN911_c0_g1_i2.p1 TRINITY_DN911_c0_g1~~TRINITY_DN911_c0_g1_i2.p1  ORF type:complete len:722 (-),score=166.03 TRINITY_DN911_c0_g1_i2:42-2207(-)
MIRRPPRSTLDRSSAASDVYKRQELKDFILPVKGDKKIPTGQIAMGNLHRQMMRISKIDSPVPKIFIPTKDTVSKLLSLSIEVEIGKKSSSAPPVLEVEEKKIDEIFRKTLYKHFINFHELIILDYEGSALMLTVNNLKVVEQSLDESLAKSFGEFDSETDIRFTVSSKATKGLKIKSDKLRETELFKLEFNFEKLGIGGLDKEASTIFRRAFNSRRYPPSIIAKYGIKHVKGMLLHGPPGTGKTLIARKIAEALQAHPPKIVNGPEVFSKFVGETEKNIRELFAEAEKEEKEAGEDSKLHIIIFDEIDAICRPRGSVNSGVAVHDTAVNQILSKLDGVESLNNILVIGMTNRKDMIDEAVLRPGRLEVHVEIGLPDEPGRLQIFRIHTRVMLENKLLGDTVDLAELAKTCKNFSGAEIEGLVKSASGFALFEGTSMASIQPIKDFASILKKVERRHFLQALEDVKPQFGVDTDEIENSIRNGIINYGPTFGRVWDTCNTFVEQVRSSTNTPLFSVLIEGPKGCGKTAFASKLGLDSKFPFVKLITPENFIGYTEQGKVNEINKIFNDSYKSQLSVIVLDDIERLIEYIHVGPRLSNAILQAILVLVKKLPPYKNRRLLVIGTTSMITTLSELGVTDSFNMVMTLPILKKPEEVMTVLEKYKAEEDEKKKIAEIGIFVPIKYLLLTLEMTLQKGAGVLTSDNFKMCLNDILKREPGEKTEQ